MNHNACILPKGSKWRSARSFFVCLFFPPVYILTYLSFHLCIHPSLCLPPLPSSLTVCLLATASPDSRGDESWRIRKQLLSCQSPAFCSQLPALLQRRDAERETESRRGWGVGGGWSDKIRTEWGSDITRREMKERESETESWCWNLSKKTLFRSPSVFLSFCFSGCFDVFRQTHSVSMVIQAHRHNTDEECQLVVRGTCCLSLLLLPNCILILSWCSVFCLTVFDPLPVLAVALNLKSVISQTFDCQSWCIDCASHMANQWQTIGK